jgi:hypothetical protein
MQIKEQAVDGMARAVTFLDKLIARGVNRRDIYIRRGSGTLYIVRWILLLLALTGTAAADWITPKGHKYHPRRDCIALTRTKQPVEISKAEAEKRGLQVCGICSKWKTRKEGK